MLSRLTGLRLLLVDDVISTGTTAAAGMSLLAKVDAPVVGLLFAMLQRRPVARPPRRDRPCRS